MRSIKQYYSPRTKALVPENKDPHIRMQNTITTYMPEL
jgi:hypothetical protein